MTICGEATRRGLLLGAVAAGASACGPAQPDEFASLGRGIDDVTLISSAGVEVRWSELRGSPRALFFGFTHCPVICPVTIYELTAAAERAGAAAERLRIDFVTVDPERDTAERMRSYFSGFGPHVTGFTGPAEHLARIMRAFEITATRTPLERGGYTVDHTATVFLIDRAARVADVIAYGSEPEIIDERLGALLRR